MDVRHRIMSSKSGVRELRADKSCMDRGMLEQEGVSHGFKPVRLSEGAVKAVTCGVGQDVSGEWISTDSERASSKEDASREGAGDAVRARCNEPLSCA